jgi:hypothetical protein
MIIGEPTRKARPLDHGDQLCRGDDAGNIAQHGPLARQVHHRLYPRQLVEEFFEARRTGRTAHTLDGQLQRAWRHAETGLLDRGDDLL